ncbi:MAG: DUF503 domain-containing protein [Candidatus Omnitrophota bacterium]
MKDVTCHIGVLLIALFIPSARSLKDKRTVIKSLKDRVRQTFNVSVAELDSQDKWQVANCAIAMINSDRRYINQCLANVLSMIESQGSVEVTDHQMMFM